MRTQVICFLSRWDVYIVLDLAFQPSLICSLIGSLLLPEKMSMLLVVRYLVSSYSQQLQRGQPAIHLVGKTKLLELLLALFDGRGDDDTKSISDWILREVPQN